MLLRRRNHFATRKAAPMIVASSSSLLVSPVLNSTWASKSTSHLPLAEISPAVLHIVAESKNNNNNNTPPANSNNNTSNLSQNEQRELALIQRFMKMDQATRNEALISLCAGGAFEIVPFALAAGCDLTTAIDAESNATPLYHACVHGHWECAQKFLALAPEMALKEVKNKVSFKTEDVSAENADLDLSGDDNNNGKNNDDLVETTNCLIEAVENGHEKIVQLLVEQQQQAANNVLDTFVQSQQSADEILLKAVQSSKGQIVRSLLETENSRVKELFLNAITVNRYGDSKYTLLWLASMLNSADVVGALLDAQTETHRVDVNATTAAPNVMSALSFACLQGNVEVVKTLLTRCYAVAEVDPQSGKVSYTDNKNHLDINIRSSGTEGRPQSEGDTPLMICVTQAAIAIQTAALKQKLENYEAIIRMLVAEPTCVLDCTRSEKDDMTPLLTACTRGCENIVAMLIEASSKDKSNPNTNIDFSKRSNKSQLTPILAAAYGGSPKIFREVASECVDENDPSKFSASLLTASIDTTKQNILHLAIANGHSELVASIVKDHLFPELVKNGQDDLKREILEAKTVDLVTPLLYALHKRDIKSVEMLCDAGADMEVEGVNLAAVCETEEGMEEYANVLKKAQVRKEIAKKEKIRNEKKQQQQKESE